MIVGLVVHIKCCKCLKCVHHYVLALGNNGNFSSLIFLLIDYKFLLFKKQPFPKRNVLKTKVMNPLFNPH